MRPLRALAVFQVGMWAGMAASAAFVKRSLPSRGDEASDEVALVAVFDGVQLKSRSTSFTGGSALAWFGGIALDLREAALVPGARLSVTTLFGGIAIRTPPGWRIESDVNVLFGGVDVRAPAAGDPDAPVLSVTGTAVFGGIAVAAKAGS